MPHWLSTDANLLQVETQPDGQHLLLQQDDQIFEATLESAKRPGQCAHHPREQHAPNYRNLPGE